MAKVVNEMSEVSATDVVYVVSDELGYVTSFIEIKDANTFLEKYSYVNLIIQTFKLNPASQLEKIYVVVFKENNLVAFVSNDKEAAEHVHKTYLIIGAVHNEPIEDRLLPIGIINENDEKRLDISQKVFSGYFDGSKTLEDIAKLDIKNETFLENLLEGKVENIEKLDKQIQLMDFVIQSSVNHEVFHSSISD